MVQLVRVFCAWFSDCYNIAMLPLWWLAAGLEKFIKGLWIVLRPSSGIKRYSFDVLSGPKPLSVFPRFSAIFVSSMLILVCASQSHGSSCPNHIRQMVKSCDLAPLQCQLIQCVACVEKDTGVVLWLAENGSQLCPSVFDDTSP